MNSTNILSDLLNGNLTNVLEAASSTGKRIYQTNSGIRAMTPEEAKTDSNASLIGLNFLTSIFANNINNLQLEVKTNCISSICKLYRSIYQSC